MEYIAYEPEQLIAQLIDVVVNGHRHQDFDRVRAVRDWSQQIMTGDDQREILITYKTREDSDQQTQRIRVTNSRTQYVGNKAFNLYSEPHRADRTVSTIGNQNEASEESLEGLFENLNGFSGGHDLETWLDERFKYLNFYDANAFIVIEFDNTQPETRKPIAYPFEVSSAEAVDFEYQRGALQYLVSEQMKTYHDSDGKPVEVPLYTMYAPRVSIRMSTIPEEVVDMQAPEGATVLNVARTADSGTETIYFETFENKSETTPAVRIGAYRDPKTKLRTFVSPLWPAKHLFTDLIWTKSEYDLSKALHGFYQKFMYVDECPTCEGQGTTPYNDAENGVPMECKACQGTGTNSHLTVQDIIEVRRPESREEHIPLNEFIHYEQIPMELIKLQKEDVGDIEDDIFNAIFGSNVLDRSEVAITATEKNYDWRAVNNTLAPYADAYVNTYKAIVYQVAVHRQERGGLVVEYAFPSDFNLESVNDLIAQRAAAIGAQAPAPVVRHIDLNILHKQNKDNPQAVAAFRAKEQHRPFEGRALQEVIFLVNALPPDDYQRVLYLHFDPILDGLIVKVPTFVVQTFEQQADLVHAAVGAKIEADRLSLFPVATPPTPPEPAE